jgi:O-acetyl-ADP-ribose deacetylase
MVDLVGLAVGHRVEHAPPRAELGEKAADLPLPERAAVRAHGIRMQRVDPEETREPSARAGTPLQLQTAVTDSMSRPARAKSPTRGFRRRSLIHGALPASEGSGPGGLGAAPCTGADTGDMVQLRLHVGDITRFRADAIVNAANNSLLGGGGVDGAIHRAGGPAILAACRELRATTLPDGLPTGQAVATTAGDLPARWVIHTVGPVYSASEDRSALLASCYRESLRVADEKKALTVGFPAVSAGAYGWPMTEAARVAVESILATPTSVETVTFVLFSPDAAAAFEQALDAAGV